MNKNAPIAAAALLALATSLRAQAPTTEAELLAKLKQVEAVTAPTPPPAPAVPPKVTEITATEGASFDNEKQVAVFVGDVRVNDPQFKLTSERLTVFFQKKTPKVKAAPSPAPAATPAPEEKDGGVEKVIAEGKVVIVQEKPNANGKGVTRYVGKAARAEYDAVGGLMRLIGSPQVQEGINLHIATSPSTVMIMYRDGRAMRSEGPTRTVISEKPAEDPTAKP